VTATGRDVYWWIQQTTQQTSRCTLHTALYLITTRYHAGGPLSIRGFGGYGIGPRAPPSAPSSTELAQDVITGDALGGFAKSTFLGTLSVPINLKVIHCERCYCILHMAVTVSW
jgi:outer membrane protein assembly factor BamA